MMKQTTDTSPTDEPTIGEILIAFFDGLADAIEEDAAERVEAEPFDLGDRVVIDAGSSGAPCEAVVEVADPDSAGCVTVRTVTGHGMQEPGRLVTIHPRRLSRPGEPEDEPRPKVTVRLPDDADLVLDRAWPGCPGGNVPGSLVMSLDVARQFERHVGWAIEDSVCPF